MQKHRQHRDVQKDDNAGKAKAKIEERLGTVVTDAQEKSADDETDEYVQPKFEIQVILKARKRESLLRGSR